MSRRSCVLGVAGAAWLALANVAPAAVDGPIVVGGMMPVAPRAALMTADLGGGHPRDLGIGAAPSFSPDGRRIAYVGLDERGLAVWVVHADGSGRRRVAAAPAGATSLGRLQWSSDGRRLLTYATAVNGGSDACGGYTVLWIDARTGAIHFVGSGLTPRWSPDGRRLVRETVEFENGDPDCGLHSSSILESDVGGGGAHTLARVGGNYEDYDPVWSPRGNLVAFVDGGSLVVARPDGTGRRALMRVGGGGIVDGVSGGGNIAWSPDGRRIAAVSDVGAGALVVVPLRGRVRTVKLPRRGFPENINFDFGNLSDAVGAWSPDGRRLLYAAGSRLCTVADARARCVAKRFTRLFLAVSWHARRIAFVRPAPRQHTALLAVAAGGSRPTPLTNDGGLPTAMPDGRVAFVVDHSNKDPQDWAVDPIGGTRTRLPFDFAQTPVWSPDGGRIAVASGLAGESVSVGNADGTGLHEIARGESSPYPAWSPDGKRIAFTALSSLRVAVVDADGSHRTDLPLGGTTPGPVWSPGGSLLLGAYAFGALGPGLDEFGLDGTARAQLAGIDATRALPSAITVSPDGEWIAFTTGWGEARLGPGGADDGIAGWRLWLVRPDGSDLHRIAEGDVEHTVSGLAWSGTR